MNKGIEKCRAWIPNVLHRIKQKSRRSGTPECKNSHCEDGSIREAGLPAISGMLVSNRCSRICMLIGLTTWLLKPASLVSFMSLS